MHAVVVRVNFNDVDAAETMLHEEIVPTVSQIPGFVSGWWTQDLDRTNGMGLMVFDSEETAQGVKARMESSQGPDGNPAVSLQGVEVRQVAANASA
jgi:uncharacterized protein involved in tolerance to divalent cations